MSAKIINIFDSRDALNAPIGVLIARSYYSSDSFTDEELDAIAERAKHTIMPMDFMKIPTLVKLDRQRRQKKDNTLPYESLKLRYILKQNIKFHDVKDYGEVDIYDCVDEICIKIHGEDEKGKYFGGYITSIDEFLFGDEEWLENSIHDILQHGKRYQEKSKFLIKVEEPLAE